MRATSFFFRGTQFDSSRDAPASDQRPGQAQPPAARLLAFFDISPDYKRVKHHLRASASRQGVDYELLQALIATESGFDAGAVSPKGAIGLMQVMPATAGRFGVAADPRRTVAEKRLDPALNVSAGTRYLRYLLDLFPGRLDLALAAYNAGEGAVQRAGNRIPAYKETQNYYIVPLKHLRKCDHVRSCQPSDSFWRLAWQDGRGERRWC